MTTETEWLEWRRQGITATDVAMAHTGRYGGRYAVVARKLGLLPPQEQTDYMARGHDWEQPVADAVHALTGYFVVGEQAWCQHPEHDWQRATVDGFLAPVAVATPDDVVAGLEIKTRRRGNRPDWAYWNSQVQWQMWVTGQVRTLVASAAFNHDGELAGVGLDWVDADPDEQAWLMGVAESLWWHVQNATLPPPDTPSALDTVKAVYPDADQDADTAVLDDVAEALERLDAIRKATKAVDNERRTLEALVRDRLGAATHGATATGWRVALSVPRRVLTDDGEAAILAARPDLGHVTLDRTRAKAEAPDLYDEHREAVGARVLTITPPKEGHA